MMTPEEILKICLEILEEHRILTTDPIYYKKKTKTFSFLDEEPNGTWEQITDEQVKSYMLKIIKTHLRTQKKIFLYTCKDNQLIAFEELESLDEELEFFHKQDDNFYIAYD